MTPTSLAKRTASDGTWEGPCGLFGIERDGNGMLRAVSQGRPSAWAVDFMTAKLVRRNLAPVSAALTAGITSGDVEQETQARNEVYRFLESWDETAPAWMSYRLFELLDGQDIDPSAETMRVVAEPDGLFYLKCDNGMRSKAGAHAEVAALVLSSWDGLPDPVDFTREDASPGELSEFIRTVVDRWDTDCECHAAELARAHAEAGRNWPR